MHSDDLLVQVLASRRRGAGAITVADEAARYALTGISSGQLVKQSVATSFILVSDAGNSDANGEYKIIGTLNGFTYYKKEGEECYIYNESGTWYITTGSTSNIAYYSNDQSSENPWDVAANSNWEAATGDDGPVGLPVPVVTEVPRTDVTYRLLAPSTAQGGVAVLGGSQDGIYLKYGDSNGRPLFTLLGEPEGASFAAIWGNNGDRWDVTNFEGDPLYYSLSDVATPDLATDWKNASDDSPAGITVTSITEGELNAGVTVAGAGTEENNGSFTVIGNNLGYNSYGGSITATDSSGSWQLGEWVGIDYFSDDAASFPWEVTYSANDGEDPPPTVTRNDIAAPANWEEV